MSKQSKHENKRKQEFREKTQAKSANQPDDKTQHPSKGEKQNEGANNKAANANEASNNKAKNANEAANNKGANASEGTNNKAENQEPQQLSSFEQYLIIALIILFVFVAVQLVRRFAPKSPSSGETKPITQALPENKPASIGEVSAKKPTAEDTKIKEFVDYEQVYRDIKNSEYKDNAQQKAKDIKNSIEKIKQENIGKEDYELIVAKLKTSLCMLEGGCGMAEFLGGNKNENSVCYIKEALELTKNYPENRDFQGLKKFIAETCIPQLFNNGQYSEVVSLLKDDVEQEAAKGDGSSCSVENLKMFFKSILQAGSGNSSVSFAEGQRLAEKLAKNNHNEPAFIMYSYRFDNSFTELADYKKLYELLKDKDKDLGSFNSGSIESKINKLDSEKGLKKKLKAYTNIENKKEYEQHIEWCDLKIAQLKTSLWMLEGGGGKKTFPDGNKDKKGVCHREDALELAKKYPENSDFWSLRKFIAETVKEQYKDKYRVMKWISNVYFNGKKLEKPELELADEIKKCDDNINRLKGGK